MHALAGEAAPKPGALRPAHLALAGLLAAAAFAPALARAEAG
jgi:hypothetical protein